MRTRILLAAAATAVVLGSVPLAAQAAPAIGPTAVIQPAADAGTVVQKAHWRHRRFGYFYAPRRYWHYRHWHRPYYYGYGPAIGFFIGPRWRHHHRRWWW